MEHFPILDSQTPTQKEDEAEQALMVLAEPISWEWIPYPGGDGEGGWEGKSERASYRIASPEMPGDVDATPYERDWGLYMFQQGDRIFQRIPVPSVEYAKHLCLLHKSTGDLTGIEALQTAAKNEFDNSQLHERRTAARKQLLERFQWHKTPRLDFDPIDKAASVFTAMGTRGTYSMRFDSTHRWIVTVTDENGDFVEERAFITRQVAKMACAFHSQKGKWRGVLGQEILPVEILTEDNRERWAKYQRKHSQ